MSNTELFAKYRDAINKCKNLSAEISNSVIAIDGRAASGKSTLAELIANEISGTVIHADDFFLPHELRTTDRLSEPGGNIHYERLYDEVIRNLKKSKDFSYGIYDCKVGNITSHRFVSVQKPIIIEGAYSGSPRFGKYYDALIFVTAPYGTRIERVRLRNGEEKVKMFAERWMPLEEAYFASYDIEKEADIVINT